MARDHDLGRRLIRWRAWRSMEQQELCTRLGITRQRLWDWETHGVPKGDTVLLILAMAELTRRATPEQEF